MVHIENVLKLQKVTKSAAFCKLMAWKVKMDLRNYILSLAAKGKSYFTESDALNALGISKIALRAALRRLKKKREIACPLSGFFLIVPPEYQSLQSLPPEQFIDDLMQHLKTSYYVALLSAAQFYGAAHQKPQTFQVIIPRARRNIEVGRVKISFTTKSDADQSAIRQFNTPRGFVQVADPATVAIDLIAFPQKSGGISAVFEILSDLSEHLNVESCKKAIPQLKRAPLLQRLGYFFELLSLTEQAQLCEKELKNHLYVKKVLLDPHEKLEGALLNTRWNLIINTELEIEHDT
jgi:predicted transcriptional regulator of viral defense system